MVLNHNKKNKVEVELLVTSAGPCPEGLRQSKRQEAESILDFGLLQFMSGFRMFVLANVLCMSLSMVGLLTD